MEFDVTMKSSLLRWLRASVIMAASAHGAGAYATSPLFTEAALEKGLLPVHTQRAETLRGIPDTLGPGACVLDINNDLWPDLLVLGGTGSTRHFGKPNWWATKGRNQLYLNRHGVFFEDIADTAGLTDMVNGQGCTSGDLNNDGFADLLITTTGTDLLYRNNGDNTFTLVADTTVTQRNEWTSGVLFVDINNDRLLDIYVGGFVKYQQDKNIFEAGTGFQGAVSASFSPEHYDAVVSRLYLNRGNFQFDDITVSSGIENRSGRTLGVYWHDLNQDNLPDLIELNSFASDSKAWINQGDNTFVAEAARQALFENNAVNALGLADLNHDGVADATFSGQAAQPAILKRNLKEDISWYHHPLAVATVGTTSWGLSLQDFDNDGLRDLFLANGLLMPHSDAPASTQGQPDQLFLASQHGFQPASAAPDARFPKASRAVVSADFNNDGALDLYVSANNGFGQFFLNRSAPRHWIQVIARDITDFYRPLSVSVTTQDKIWHAFAGEPHTHLGKSEERFHFGLGEYRGDVTVTVTWQDGRQQTFPNLQPDGVYLVSPSQVICRARGVVRTDQARCVTDYGIAASTPPPHPVLPELHRALLAWKTALLASPLSDLPSLAENPLPKGLSRETLLLASEHDESLYWLMHALAGTNDPCMLTPHFIALFDEEEASIQNKYLSLPALIHALARTSASGKECLIEALGHSERYRANSAVLSQLEDDAESVRLAAVVALGRLRQTDSLPALQRVISEAGPTLAAQAMLSAEQINKEAGMVAWKNRLRTLPANQQQRFRQALAAAMKKRPLIHHDALSTHPHREKDAP